MLCLEANGHILDWRSRGTVSLTPVDHSWCIDVLISLVDGEWQHILAKMLPN